MARRFSDEALSGTLSHVLGLTILLAVVGCGGTNENDAATDTTTSKHGEDVTTNDSSAVARPSTDALPELATVFSSSPIDQSEVGTQYRHALQLLDEGHVEAATAIQQELLQHPQYSALGEAVAGMQLAKQGQHDEAIKVAEQLSTVPVMKPEACMIAAESFRVQRRWGDAIDWLNRAVEMNLGLSRAHRWLGILYHDTGAMQLATMHLRTAADIDVKDYRSLRLSGLIYYEYKNFQEATADYERALRRSPPSQVSTEIRLELADSLRELRRFDDALETLESCDPSGPVWAYRAKCLEAKGDVATAKSAAKRSINENSEAHLPNLIYGRLSLADREFETAVEHLRKAVSAEPTDHVARFSLGRALIQSGEKDEGAAEIKRSTEMKELFLEIAALHIKAVEQPSNVDLRLKLGELTAKSGRHRVAITWYQAALGLDSTNETAKEALERLTKETAE